MKNRLILILFYVFFINYFTIAQMTAIEWYDRGMEEDNISEKIKHFDNALKQDENYSDAYFQKGLALFQSLRPKEALAQINIAIQIEAKKEYFEGRGMVYFDLRNFNSALTDFNEVLKRNVNNRKVILKRAIALYELAKYSDALSAFDEIIQVEPLNYEALIGKSKTLMGIGKMTNAFQIINDVLKHDASNQEALFNLGRWYELNNDTTNAMVYYRKILNINRKNVDANQAITRITTNIDTQPCQTCPPVVSLPSLSSFKRKYALMIGNSDYKDSGWKSLEKQPINDATAMGKKLSSFGFQTEVLINASKVTFENALNSLCNQVENADVVFLFYAGHGIEKDGLNYFLPTDTNADSAYTHVKKHIELQEILGRLQAKNVKYVVIVADACRTKERGFTPLNNEPANKVQVSPKSPSNYYIGYATLTGKNAKNGLNQNGYYTSALLNAIKKGVRLDDAFRNARTEVLQKTGNEQLPENTEGMSQPFIFN